jgi:hypothetical protein
VKPFGEPELRATPRPYGSVPRAAAHRVFESLDQAVAVSQTSDCAIRDDVEVCAPSVGDFARSNLVEVADLPAKPNAAISVLQEAFADADEVLSIRYGDRIGDQHLLARELRHHALRGARRGVSVYQRPTAWAV